MQNLVVIEAPFNLGLMELVTGQPPGVSKLPAWLMRHGLYQNISAKKILNIPAPPYSIKLDAGTGIRNADAIVAYSQTLAASVQRVLNDGDFPLIIGGDCSILLGCTLGAKRHGNYGLFFMDGHTDYVTTVLSATKAAAGMDLALVTGKGPGKLTDIDGQKPYVDEANTLAFGNRYEDEAYVDLILNSGITYFSLIAARHKGIETVVVNFIEHVRSRGLDGLWIHLDVDVLDDEVMPCVDSRQAGGLTYAEFNQIFKLLMASGLAKGMNITILDPELDPEGIYAANFVKEISKVFGI